MSKKVREPIQVYLTPDERGALDACAAQLGVSRSEVLRRGLRALGSEPTGRSALDRNAGVLSPARSAGGAPPPSLPVAPLAELLDELAADRDDL